MNYNFALNGRSLFVATMECLHTPVTLFFFTHLFFRLPIGFLSFDLPFIFLEFSFLWYIVDDMNDSTSDVTDGLFELGGKVQSLKCSLGLERNLDH